MCTSFFFVGNTPLIRWLLPAFGPIPFFMILSGYGLAYKYETGKLGFRGQVPRVLRLYVHYWVILALFLVVGHMMEPSLYPGKMTKLLKNMIGWNVSYNSAMWFLLPYSILSLLSFYVIRLVERIGNLWAIVITIAIEVCTSFHISRYGDILIEHQFVYQPLLCFHLLQPFTIGIVPRRTSFSLDRSLLDGDHRHRRAGYSRVLNRNPSTQHHLCSLNDHPAQPGEMGRLAQNHSHGARPHIDGHLDDTLLAGTSPIRATVLFVEICAADLHRYAGGKLSRVPARDVGGWKINKALIK